MSRSAAIFGLSGLALTADEKAFFRDCDPAGFIIFARNVETPDQVRALVESLHDVTGRDRLAVHIDQEGGRVQRLRAPHWREAPRLMVFGDLYDRDPADALRALDLNIRLIAAELVDLGITVDCIPLLDLPQPDADEVIGDRAFGSISDDVIALGKVTLDVCADAGILPVVKHFPGHGRSRFDSHKVLPLVETPLDELRRVDFAPFRPFADAPFGMTAHIKYAALDPVDCATHSRIVIQRYIREEIGFKGMLMSDDLCMKALSGPMRERAARAMTAGCDLALHCSGNFDEMQEVLPGAGDLEPGIERRLEAALAGLSKPVAGDRNGMLADLNSILKKHHINA